MDTPNFENVLVNYHTLLQTTTIGYSSRLVVERFCEIVLIRYCLFKYVSVL
jgi:hypothetical protein